MARKTTQSLAWTSLAAGVGILAAAAALTRPAAPRVALLDPDQSAIEDTVSAIQRADREIVALVYKFDDPSVLKALRQAAKKEVRIRIVADREASDEQGSLIKKARKLGAKIRMPPRKRGKLHAKFLIVDEREVLFGSFNWTRSAADKNMELLVLQQDPDTVRQFLELFEEIWRESKPKGKKP